MEENKNVPWSGYERAPAKPAALPFFPTGRKEAVFGVLIVIFSIFLANSFINGGFNLGYALGMLATTGAAAVYLLRTGCRGTWYGWTLLGLSLLIVAGFARTDDGFVKFVMVCFLFVSINLGLCDIAGKTLWDTGSVRSLTDCFRTGFGLGVGKISHAFRGIRIALQSGGNVTKKGSAVLLGAVIAVPVLAVMIPLLMSADAAFEGLLDLLPEFDFEEAVYTVFIAAGIFCVVYTRAVALKHHPKAIDSYVNLRKGLSALTVNTALGAVCALYGVYLLSQLAYFVGGFAGILPEGYTVAEYARRGFFEMAWLCIINLSLMILAISFTEKKVEKTPLSTRILCLFVGIVTLFLVVAAGAKMVLYIGSFGMTRLRVLTMVIMVFLGLTTAVVTAWLFAPKLPYMKVVVLTAMILGAAVLWTDVDSVVAKYNVDAYLSGALQEVDFDHLRQLGSGAVPSIHRLAQEAPDELIRNRAKDILTNRLHRYDVDFQDWNYTNATADDIVGEYSYYEDVKDLCGLDISGSTIVFQEDSHGGLLGDGALLVEFDCAPISDVVIPKMSGWNTLPLSENLHLVMYGGAKNGTVYAHELAERYGIPEIQNGCYYFVDRHAESTDSSSDDNLLSRASFNFSIVIYNADNAHLYLFEFDT